MYCPRCKSRLYKVDEECIKATGVYTDDFSILNRILTKWEREIKARLDQVTKDQAELRELMDDYDANRDPVEDGKVKS